MVEWFVGWMDGRMDGYTLKVLRWLKCVKATHEINNATNLTF